MVQSTELEWKRRFAMLKRMGFVLISLVLCGVILIGCSEDPQKTLERAVDEKDAKSVETSLAKGADPSAERAGRPTIFQEVIFHAMDDNIANGADGLKNPIYSILCRKWRAKYPAVDADLTLKPGIIFMGLGSSGAQLMASVTATHEGKSHQVSFSRDETEFKNMKIANGGYAIGIVEGQYKVKGRLVNELIEAESVEYTGPPNAMEVAMLIPIRRYLPSTVGLHYESTAAFFEWKKKAGSQGGQEKRNPRK
jgi:hypothetical protein